MTKSEKHSQSDEFYNSKILQFYNFKELVEHRNVVATISAAFLIRVKNNLGKEVGRKSIVSYLPLNKLCIKVVILIDTYVDIIFQTF